jgi:hypothetical protein
LEALTLSGQAALDYDGQRKALKEDQSEFIKDCSNLTAFVTDSSKVFDSEAIKTHQLSKYIVEISKSVTNLTRDIVQPVQPMYFPGEQSSLTADNSQVNGLDNMQDHLDKASGSDWKTKLVFTVFLSVVVVAATILGFVGHPIPIHNPDGTLAISTTYVNGATVTQVQTVLSPWLPMQWVIAIWVIMGVFAAAFFLPGVVAGFMAVFAKKPEEALPESMQLGKIVSDKLNQIMERYLADVALPIWQPATEANRKDHHVAGTPSYAYSYSEQRKLTFPVFALTRINDVMFIVNGEVSKQLDLLNQYTASLYTTPPSPARPGV